MAVRVQLDHENVLGSRTGQVIRAAAGRVEIGRPEEAAAHVQRAVGPDLQLPGSRVDLSASHPSAPDEIARRIEFHDEHVDLARAAHVERARPGVEIDGLVEVAAHVKAAVRTKGDCRGIASIRPSEATSPNQGPFRRIFSHVRIEMTGTHQGIRPRPRVEIRRLVERSHREHVPIRVRKYLRPAFRRVALRRVAPQTEPESKPRLGAHQARVQVRPVGGAQREHGGHALGVGVAVQRVVHTRSVPRRKGKTGVPHRRAEDEVVVAGSGDRKSVLARGVRHDHTPRHVVRVAHRAVRRIKQLDRRPENPAFAPVLLAVPVQIVPDHVADLDFTGDGDGRRVDGAGCAVVVHDLESHIPHRARGQAGRGKRRLCHGLVAAFGRRARLAEVPVAVQVPPVPIDRIPGVRIVRSRTI